MHGFKSSDKYYPMHNEVVGMAQDTIDGYRMHIHSEYCHSMQHSISSNVIEFCFIPSLDNINP
jgi:hypothetical protein